MKITMKQRLAMYSKVSRETNHIVKPMVIADKKKKHNKNLCRKKVVYP